jgi:hypothetical protein
MKNLRTKLSYALYTLLVAVLFSCTPETKQNRQEEFKEEKYISNTEIIKVRNCEYVLWYNGYGSDMEHYEGCKNTEHCY